KYETKLELESFNSYSNPYASSTLRSSSVIGDILRETRQSSCSALWGSRANGRRKQSDKKMTIRARVFTLNLTLEDMDNGRLLQHAYQKRHYVAGRGEITSSVSTVI